MKNLFLIILAFVLIGCANNVNNNDSNKTKEPIQLNEGANDTVVNVLTDQKIIISLRGNPTTGFVWSLQNINSGVIRLIGKDFMSDSGGSELVGVGGKYIFEFVADKQGKTNLEFIYKRPWVGGETAQTFTVTINVAD